MPRVGARRAAARAALLCPALELDDVALGIADVAPGHPSTVGGRQRHDVADRAATGSENGGTGFDSARRRQSQAIRFV
jgi:hypothetical protein